MAKMIKCKVCSNEIASNAKFCPSCGAQNKKPFYKRPGVIVAGLVIIGVISTVTVNNSTDTSSSSNTVGATRKVAESTGTKTENITQSEDIVEVGNNLTSTKDVLDENTAKVEKEEATTEVGGIVGEKEVAETAKVPTSYKSALRKAEQYSELMHMSKKGIYSQLTSEYGEQFDTEAAQYAVDHIEADWNANALEKAKTYQDTMAMSPRDIYDQLVSEYGEQFTVEEAQYAVDHLE